MGNLWTYCLGSASELGTSSGTEPLPCGFSCYLQADSVRTDLNYKTPVGICRELENSLVWKTHWFDVISVVSKKRNEVFSFIPSSLPQPYKIRQSFRTVPLDSQTKQEYFLIIHCYGFWSPYNMHGFCL